MIKKFKTEYMPVFYQVKTVNSECGSKLAKKIFLRLQCMYVGMHIVYGIVYIYNYGQYDFFTKVSIYLNII